MLDDTSKPLITGSTECFIDKLSFNIENHKDEYAEYHNESVRKSNKYIGATMIVVDLIKCIALFFQFKKDNLFIVHCIMRFLVISIDIPCFIISLKTKLNSFWNKFASYSKLIFILRSFIHLITIAERELTNQNYIQRKMLFISEFYPQIFLAALIYLTTFNASIIYGFFLLTSFTGVTLFCSLRTPDNKFEFVFEFAACLACFVLY